MAAGRDSLAFGAVAVAAALRVMLAPALGIRVPFLLFFPRTWRPPVSVGSARPSGGDRGGHHRASVCRRHRAARCAAFGLDGEGGGQRSQRERATEAGVRLACLTPRQHDGQAGRALPVRRATPRLRGGSRPDLALRHRPSGTEPPPPAPSRHALKHPVPADQRVGQCRAEMTEDQQEESIGQQAMCRSQ